MPFTRGKLQVNVPEMNGDSEGTLEGALLDFCTVSS